jgi:hypothetical protein
MTARKHHLLTGSGKGFPQLEVTYERLLGLPGGR